VYRTRTGSTVGGMKLIVSKGRWDAGENKNRMRAVEHHDVAVRKRKKQGEMIVKAALYEASEHIRSKITVDEA